MTTISSIDLKPHQRQMQELFWEYLTWANDRNAEEFGIRLDIRAILEDDMTHPEKYIPPQGQLVIAEDQARIVGCICLKSLSGSVGELKRLYVQPSQRRQGIGKALVAAVTEQARQMGFHTLRLDSARYMTDAHALYHVAGFRDIDPYPESEIPPEFRPWWVFMEMQIAPT